MHLFSYSTATSINSKRVFSHPLEFEETSPIKNHMIFCFLKNLADFSEMSNDLWLHALKVLETFRSSNDKQDVYKLYEFHDQTGILNEHKEYLNTVYEDNNKVDVKVMYFELIKMLMDKDKGLGQTKDLDKIQGKFKQKQLKDFSHNCLFNLDRFSRIDQ